jgi:hypothetical protein
MGVEGMVSVTAAPHLLQSMDASQDAETPEPE